MLEISVSGVGWTGGELFVGIRGNEGIFKKLA